MFTRPDLKRNAISKLLLWSSEIVCVHTIKLYFICTYIFLCVCVCVYYVTALIIFLWYFRPNFFFPLLMHLKEEDSFEIWHVALFLQVMSIKAIGIAIELTLEGSNQLGHFQTWIFLMVSVTCIIIQLNYLNKVYNNCFFPSLSHSFYIFVWYVIFTKAQINTFSR